MRVRDVTDSLSFLDKIHDTEFGSCPTMLVEESFPTCARQTAARLAGRVGIQYLTPGALVRPRHHRLRGRLCHLLLPTELVEPADGEDDGNQAPHRSIRLARAWRLRHPPRLWGEVLADPYEADQYVELIHSAGQVLFREPPTAALQLLFERIADLRIEPALLLRPSGRDMRLAGPALRPATERPSRRGSAG